MPFFAYRARDTDGKLLLGVLEAAETGGVADQLFSNGLIPIEITLSKAPPSAGGVNWWESMTEKSVTSMDVQMFSRQMYTLMKSGVPILRGLAGLEESSISKSFARVLKDMREALDAGRELSAAMRRHPKVFSNFYLSMVRVGELTGRMEEVFLRLFDHLEFDREMKARVKSALRYPMFVVIAMIGAMVVVNLFVIPAFVRVFASFNAELPLMTRILIATSNFSVRFWPLLLVGAISAVVGWIMYLKTPKGRYQWDKFKLRLPIAGPILLKGTLARFARSFALANRSGVPIVQGLSVVAATVENAYLSSRVEGMREGVERGESILRTAIHAGVFTPVVLQMIAVGEETGELDSLMEEIAQMYEREVDYELKTLSANIEPIMVVFLGIMVLILALGIFLPIWDLGRAALRK
jgi:MSHA biogenesis protein MshG